MVTVDYEYYKTVFGGTTVPDDKFNFILRKANYLLSDITLGRSDSVSDDDDLAGRVKDCLCGMCDSLEFYRTNIGQGGAIKTSETASKWSVSYDVSKAPKTESSACLRVAETYIGDTELMCRWV